MLTVNAPFASYCLKSAYEICIISTKFYQTLNPQTKPSLQLLLDPCCSTKLPPNDKPKPDFVPSFHTKATTYLKPRTALFLPKARRSAGIPIKVPGVLRPVHYKRAEWLFFFLMLCGLWRLDRGLRGARHCLAPQFAGTWRQMSLAKLEITEQDM